MNIHITSQNRVYEPNPGDRLHLPFRTGHARLARSGHDLVIRYPDGRVSTVRGFYNTDDLTVIADGRELSPESLSEVAEIPQRTRIRDYDVMDALDGLDHLGGLEHEAAAGASRISHIAHDAPEGPKTYASLILIAEPESEPVMPEPEPEPEPKPVTPKPQPEPDPDPEPQPEPEPDPEPEPEPDAPTITPDKPTTPDPETPDHPFDPNDALHSGALVSQAVFAEADLAKGPVSQSGYLDIAAPGGLSAIMVSGRIVWSGGALSDEASRVFNTDEGRLVITDFANGRLSYTYTLSKSSLEHGRQGRDSISHSFTLAATDENGKSGGGAILIRIVDDMPQAGPDSAILDEAISATLAGTVAANDNPGQDGWGRFELVSDQGKYGTLSMNPDGSYVYALEKPLPEGDPEETFTYRAYDADGDYSEAALTIRLLKAPEEKPEPDPDPEPDPEPEAPTVTPDDPKPIDPEVPDHPFDPNDALDPSALVAEAVFAEADLAKGPLAQSGYLAIDAPGGLSLIAVSGRVVWSEGALADISQRTFDTDEGCLVITGFSDDKLSYAFTLSKSSLEHSRQGRDPISHSFTITAIDENGKGGTGHIVARIVDDIPQAGPDSASLIESPNATLSGTVAANDEPGQDGWGAARYTLVSGEGEYGTLSMNPDGSYLYTLTKPLPDDPGATETFAYRAWDADGDYSESALTINLVKALGLSLHLSDDSWAAPDSQTLPGRNAVFDTPSGIAVAGGDPYEWDISQDGLTLTGHQASESGAGNVIVLELSEDAEGNSVITARMTHPAAHDPGAGVLTVSGIVLKGTDAEGRVIYARDISLDIGDSEPVANDQQASLEPGQSVTLDDIYDWGADFTHSLRHFIVNGQRAEETDRVKTAHGWLDIWGSGQLRYTADDVDIKGTFDATDIVDFTVVDADGTSRTATLTFNLHGEKVMPLEASVTADEADFGAEQELWTLPDLDIPDGTRFECAYGHITARDGKLWYTQDKAFHHDGSSASPQDSAAIRASGPDGSVYEIDVEIRIRDSGPDAGGFEGVDMTGNGNPDFRIDAGQAAQFAWNPDFGADGPGSLIATNAAGESFRLSLNAETAIIGEYGTLYLTPGGSCRYVADNAGYRGYGNDSFQIEMTDEDGSEDGRAIHVTIHAPKPEILATIGSDIDEGDLGEGPAAAFGTVAVDLHGIDGTIEIGSLLVTVKDGEASWNPLGVYRRDGAAFSIADVTEDAGKWEIRVQAAITEADDYSGATVEIPITAKVQDIYGIVKDAAALSFGFVEDVPEVADSAGSLYMGESVAGNLDIDWGADDRETSLYVIADGVEHEVSDTAVIPGKYGMLTMEPDGSYVYDAKAGASAAILDAEDARHCGIAASAALAMDAEAALPAAGPESPEITLGSGSTIIRVLKQGSHGQIAQDASGRWVYVLGEAIDSGGEQGPNIVDGDQAILLVEDASGVQWPVRVIVHIKDDVPSLEVTPETDDSGSIGWSYGADDWGGRMAFSVTGPNGEAAGDLPLAVPGEYGTLTIEADGSYAYRGAGASADAPVWEEFTIRVVDADGDEATATLSFEVKPMPQLTFDAITMQEKIGGEMALALPEGYSIKEIAEGPKHGHLEEKDGQWVYVLDKAIDALEGNTVRAGVGTEDSDMTYGNVDFGDIGDVWISRVEWLDVPEGGASYGNFSGSYGNYSYRLDNRNPEVMALKGDEVLTETWSYKVYGYDDDWNETLLKEDSVTITIKGHSDGSTVNMDADAVKFLVTTPDGGSAIAEIPVNVRESVPAISEAGGQSADGGRITGKLDVDWGADRGELWISEDSEYWCPAYVGLSFDEGDFRLGDDGTYTYEYWREGVRSIHVRAYDADGDYAEHTILVGGKGASVTITADESRPGENVPIDLSAYSGVSVVGGGNGRYGYVEQIGGQWAYVLGAGCQNNGKTREGADDVTFTGLDAEGNVCIISVSVNITDAMPVIDDFGHGDTVIAEDGSISQQGAFHVDYMPDGPRLIYRTAAGEYIDNPTQEMFDIGYIRGSYADPVILADAGVVPHWQSEHIELRFIADNYQDEGNLSDKGVFIKVFTLYDLTGNKDMVSTGVTLTVINSGDGNFRYEVSDPEGFLNTEVHRSSGEGGVMVKYVTCFQLVIMDGDGSKTPFRIPLFAETSPDEITLDAITLQEKIGGEMALALPEGYVVKEVAEGPKHGHLEEKDGQWVYVLDEAIELVYEDGDDDFIPNSIRVGSLQTSIGGFADVGNSSNFKYIEWASEPEEGISYGIFDQTFIWYNKPNNTRWDYHLDERNPAVSALKEGETLSETWSYKVNYKDGSFYESSVVITIKGRLERPEVNLDADSVRLLVEMPDGGTAIAEIPVNVVESKPAIAGDSYAEVRDRSLCWGRLDIDYGADGPESDISIWIKTGESESWMPNYSTTFPSGNYISVNDDGSWEWERGWESKEGLDILTVRVYDKDGDYADHTIMFGEMPRVTAPAITVDEATMGENVVMDLSGYTDVKLYRGDYYGHAEQVDGQWVYALNRVFNHWDHRKPPDYDLAEKATTVEFMGKDADGNDCYITVPVNIRDDKPDADIQHGETLLNEDGSISKSGSFHVDYGADGEPPDDFCILLNHGYSYELSYAPFEVGCITTSAVTDNDSFYWGPAIHDGNSYIFELTGKIDGRDIPDRTFFAITDNGDANFSYEIYIPNSVREALGIKVQAIWLNNFDGDGSRGGGMMCWLMPGMDAPTANASDVSEASSLDEARALALVHDSDDDVSAAFMEETGAVSEPATQSASFIDSLVAEQMQLEAARLEMENV